MVDSTNNSSSASHGCLEQKQNGVTSSNKVRVGRFAGLSLMKSPRVVNANLDQTNSQDRPSQSTQSSVGQVDSLPRFSASLYGRTNAGLRLPTSTNMRASEVVVKKQQLQLPMESVHSRTDERNELETFTTEFNPDQNSQKEEAVITSALIHHYIEKGRDRRIARVLILGCAAIEIHDYTKQDSYQMIKHGRKRLFPDKEMKKQEIYSRIHGLAKADNRSAGGGPRAKKQKNTLPCSDTMRAMNAWLVTHPRDLTAAEVAFFTDELIRFEQEEVSMHHKSRCAPRSIFDQSPSGQEHLPNQISSGRTPKLNRQVLQKALDRCHHRLSQLGEHHLLVPKYLQLVDAVGTDLAQLSNGPRMLSLPSSVAEERTKQYIASWFRQRQAELDNLALVLNPTVSSTSDETSCVHDIMRDIRVRRSAIDRELELLGEGT